MGGGISFSRRGPGNGVEAAGNEGGRTERCVALRSLNDHLSLVFVVFLLLCFGFSLPSAESLPAASSFGHVRHIFALLLDTYPHFVLLRC